jgi:activator of HSP90 ATPase
VDNQIGIIADIERQIQDLEDKIKDNQATTTATSSLPVIGPVSTSTVSVSTTTNNTASTSTARRRSVNVNNSSIIYTPNPAPYRDNGVDVNYSSQNSPLQDW